MEAIIVGAGPVGLAAAILLKKRGINVRVVDPGAGSYTRTGALHPWVYRNYGDILGVSNEIIDEPPNALHTKDLEWDLYACAMDLGIPIEKIRFIGLQQDSEEPGINCVDEFGKRRFIATRHVFDCTGTKREVVSALNRIFPDSPPFQLTTISEPPVNNHFLAYVRMSGGDWNQFLLQEDVKYPSSYLWRPDERNPAPLVDPLTYAECIRKLRALGWYELKFPRCIAEPFNKNKVCLTMQAPDNLAVADYDTWVQTVLDCHTAGAKPGLWSAFKPLRYEHLPPSTKFQATKKRFSPFTFEATIIEPAVYISEDKGLPTVTPLGDAQMGSNYLLSRGIENGLERLTFLLECLPYTDMESLDVAQYQREVNALLNRTKNEVLGNFTEMEQNFAKALDEGVSKFEKALLLSRDRKEQSWIKEILMETRVRRDYNVAISRFEQIHNKDGELVRPNIDFSELERIQNALLKATTLPKNFKKEQDNANRLLEFLAYSWMDLGDASFKNFNTPKAVEAYNKALLIFELPGFGGKFLLDQAFACSNLAVFYISQKSYSDAVVAASIALDTYEYCEDLSKSKNLYEKIVFSLIRALCLQAKHYLSLDNREDAQFSYLQAQSFIADYRHILSEPRLNKIDRVLNGVAAKIAGNNARVAGNSNLFFASQKMDLDDIGSEYSLCTIL